MEEETIVTPPASTGDERAKMIAAAEAAMADAPVDEDKGLVVAEPEAKAVAPKDADAAVVIRARKLAQQMRDDAEKDRKEAAAMRAEVEKLKAEVDPWREKLPRLRETPTAVLKELGLNPEQFVESVLREGKPDPMGEVNTQVAGIKAEIEAMKAEKLKLEEERKTQEAQAATENAKKAFINLAINEKFPTLVNLYTDDQEELLEKANRIATRYFQVEGTYPTLEDIAEYLEGVELKRYNKIVGSQKQGTDREVKTPPAERANGSRTLSTATTSQKATTPIPLSEMTPQQQREYLKQQAEKAIREFGGKQ